MPRSGGTTSYTDADRARLAKFDGKRWVGPTETERCPHGRFLSFRWFLAARDSDPNKRPEAADFESGDAEYGSASCRICRPPEEDEY